MNYNNGILSIQDPKGRYMGMQDIASQFLTGRNINISTQGPKEDPKAVVVEVSAEEDKFSKEEDKTYTRIKADYKQNSTPQGFLTFLKNATTNFDADKLFNAGNTYRVYNNNGLNQDVTPEEFYIDTYNFSTRQYD